MGLRHLLFVIVLPYLSTCLLMNKQLYSHTILKRDFTTSQRHVLKSTVSALNILNQSKWYVWSLLSVSSSFGLAMEQTKLGAMLSSPLITMFTTMALCNLGMLPMSSTCYNTVLEKFVMLAIPMLLLEADIKKCIRNTGSLLKAFVIGSIGTIIGTFVAYYMVPMKGMLDAEKVAAALCARHIGGAVNFIAVADAMKISSEVVAAAMAADNIIVALYFAFIFLISPPNENIKRQEIESDAASEVHVKSFDNNINISSLSLVISFSTVVCLIGDFLSSLCSISPIIITSGITVILATLFPTQIGVLGPPGNALGVLLMQVS
jgi:uncharacterized membrane protein